MSTRLWFRISAATARKFQEIVSDLGVARNAAISVIVDQAHRARFGAPRPGPSERQRLAAEAARGYRRRNGSKATTA